MLRTFNNILYSNLKSEKETVLVVDEAQAIKDIATFEEIRLLLNFQQNERFLLTIILIGQPELIERVDKLPQLKQRLAVRYHLSNLKEADSVSYMNHRLGIASATRQIFTDKAKSLIHKLSEGVPRIINNISDMSLLIGYSENSEIIDEDLIRRVVVDVYKEK